MTPLKQTAWNKSIRDSVDALLHRGGYNEESSARHQLAMMNFDVAVEKAMEPTGLRDAVAAVCEGWTLPDGARKMLESALWTNPAPPAPTTRPLTQSEKSELLEAGVTGECVRVLAFNDRPATGERAELISKLRDIGYPECVDAADMLEADAREIGQLTNNLAAEKSIYDSAVRKNERLQAVIATLKAQQVAQPTWQAERIDDYEIRVTSPEGESWRLRSADRNDSFNNFIWHWAESIVNKGTV